jgi:hypothetical protein
MGEKKRKEEKDWMEAWEIGKIGEGSMGRYRK